MMPIPDTFNDDVHQMETFSASLAFVQGIHRSQRLVTRNFGVFFDLRLNTRLSKQPRRRWFDTLSCSLCCHCTMVTPVLSFSFQSVIFHVQRHPYFPWFTQCVTYDFFPSVSHEMAYNLFNITAMYLAPLVVIIIAYSLILCEIYRQSKEVKGKCIHMFTGSKIPPCYNVKQPNCLETLLLLMANGI